MEAARERGASRARAPGCRLLPTRSECPRTFPAACTTPSTAPVVPTDSEPRLSAAYAGKHPAAAAGGRRPGSAQAAPRRSRWRRSGCWPGFPPRRAPARRACTADKGGKGAGSAAAGGSGRFRAGSLQEETAQERPLAPAPAPPPPSLRARCVLASGNSPIVGSAPGAGKNPPVLGSVCVRVSHQQRGGPGPGPEPEPEPGQISLSLAWMMSPPSMTQMSSRIDCIALKRTKCGSFSLRTTSRYLVTRAGGRRGESRFFLGGLGAGLAHGEEDEEGREAVAVVSLGAAAGGSRPGRRMTAKAFSYQGDRQEKLSPRL